MVTSVHTVQLRWQQWRQWDEACTCLINRFTVSWKSDMVRCGPHKQPGIILYTWTSLHPPPPSSSLLYHTWTAESCFTHSHCDEKNSPATACPAGNPLTLTCITGCCLSQRTTICTWTLWLSLQWSIFKFSSYVHKMPNKTPKVQSQWSNISFHYDYR